jgi:hypothetical protein
MPLGTKGKKEFVLKPKAYLPFKERWDRLQANPKT